jgi:hypothetical protein
MTLHTAYLARDVVDACGKALPRRRRLYGVGRDGGVETLQML